MSFTNTNFDIYIKSALILVGSIMIPIYFAFPYIYLNPKQIDQIVDLIQFSYVLILLFSLIYGNFSELNGAIRLYGGSYIHPSNLGLIALLLFFLSIYKIIKNSNIRHRNFYFQIFALILSSISLIFTLSRGPIFGFVLFGFIIFISLREYYHKAIYKISITLFLILSLSFIYLMISRIEFTINSIIQGNERIYIWKHSLLQILENPFWGSNMILEKLNAYPHNIYLEIVMLTGIPGFVLLSFILYRSAKSIISFSNKSRAFGLLFLFFSIHLFVSFFSGSITTNTELWYLLSFVLMLDFKKRNVNLNNKGNRARDTLKHSNIKFPIKRLTYSEKYV